MGILARWRHRRAIRRGRLLRHLLAKHRPARRPIHEALILWDSSDDASNQIKSPEAVAYVASLPSNKEHNHAT